MRFWNPSGERKGRGLDDLLGEEARRLRGEDLWPSVKDRLGDPPARRPPWSSRWVMAAAVAAAALALVLYRMPAREQTPVVLPPAIASPPARLRGEDSGTELRVISAMFHGNPARIAVLRLKHGGTVLFLRAEEEKGAAP